MSLARRLELLAWARKSGAVIFEDDYDSEYRYSGRPIPALQGLDDCGLVLYAGSFSKVLFPSLRLGYMVVPFDFLHHFEAMMATSSSGLGRIQMSPIGSERPRSASDCFRVNVPRARKPNEQVGSKTSFSRP